MGLTGVCERYVAALDRGDIDAIDALFTPDAEVISPLYGRLAASEFHRALLTDARAAHLELRNLFDAANRAPAGAMHLRCALTFAEETVEFDAVDLFELTPDGERFTRLTIIYDSPATRAAYAALRERQLAEAVSCAVLSAA